MKQLAFFALPLLVACGASAPRPRILAETELTRDSVAVRAALRDAPQAHARAEDLRKRAEAAQAAGDSASAQILGEQALAAYERAVVLARLTQAEARRGDATARLARAEGELKALDEQERQVRAETEDLELRARVITDTLPVAESTPAPERERARLDAARALALQARLLCASARLLDPSRPSLQALTAEQSALDARLSARGPAPIDDAVRLRSRCLAELGQVRRPKTLSEPARGAEDALLAELSNAKYEPWRDDRGLVVTLHGVFGKDGQLSGPATATLQALGRAAASHAEFPILVVLHRAAASTIRQDQPRLDQVVAALKAAGASRIDSAWGGSVTPVVEPARAGAAERNERVEVVFVAPRSG
jgi:hypothetical protein